MSKVEIDVVAWLWVGLVRCGAAFRTMAHIPAKNSAVLNNYRLQ